MNRLGLSSTRAGAIMKNYEAILLQQAIREIERD